jgi:hypothetical protein
MAEVKQKFLISVVAGGVDASGEPTWLTERRVRKAVDLGKSFERASVPFRYACFPTSMAHGAASTLRKAFKKLHPEYDGEVLTPPADGDIPKKSDRIESIRKNARARGEHFIIVRPF